MEPEAKSGRTGPARGRRLWRLAILLAAGLGGLAGLTLLVGPSLSVEPGGRAFRFSTASRPLLPSLSVAVTKRPDGKRALSVELGAGLGR